MAIAYDNSYGGTISSSESVSRSFTIGSGSDRYLIAFLYGSAATESPCKMTSVQYNSSSMTYLGEIVDVSGGGDYNVIQCYYMLHAALPSGGSYNFTCTANASLYVGGVQLLSLSGALQGAPEATDLNSTTSGLTSWSNSITTLTDGAWVVDSFTVWNGNTLAANGGQTERGSTPIVMFGNYNGGISTELQPTAGSETQGWSWTLTSQILEHYLLSIAPAGAAAAYNAPFFGTNF